MSFGTFFRYYDEHLIPDATDTAIGLVGGVQAFMTLLLSFIIGRLLDAKFHRSVVAVGGVLTWLGYFCLSFNELAAGEKGRGCYWFIVLMQSIVAGVGMSCFFMHSSHCAIQVSEGKQFQIIASFSWIRADIVSVLSGSRSTDILPWVSLLLEPPLVRRMEYAFLLPTPPTHRHTGGLAYPLAITYFITEHGFPGGIRLVSAIIGGVSAICFQFGASNPAAKTRPMTAFFHKSTWIDVRAFKNFHFLTYSIGVGFIFLAFYPLLFHVTEWAEQEVFRGISVVWYLTTVNGYVMNSMSSHCVLSFYLTLYRCSAVGRLSSAAIASARYGSLKIWKKQILIYVRWSNPAIVHAVSCLFAGLVVFIFWPLAQNESHALAFCVLFGILGGSLFGLPASGVAFILPTELADSIGAWTGMMWAMSSVFALVGPPIVGQLVKLHTIKSVAWLTGANLFVATGLISGATWLKYRQDKEERRKHSVQSMRTIASVA